MRETARGVIDANGRGTVQVSPSVYKRTWLITHIFVSSSSVLATVCDLYRNAETPSERQESTTAGNADSFTYNPAVALRGSETLLAVWSGGTPGATVTMNLEGQGT